MPYPDSRGKCVLRMAAWLGLNILNEGRTSTFVRSGYEDTIPDISMTSEELTGYVKGCAVIENYTGSDHQYIVSQITPERQKQSSQNKVVMPRWNFGKMNEGKLSAELDKGQKRLANARGSTHQGQAEQAVETRICLIQQACRASVPYKRPRRKRTAIYWWTEEIAELRGECLRQRRKMQRARRNKLTEATQKTTEYKHAKKLLQKAIKRSKLLNWKSLCTEVTEKWWTIPLW